MRARFTLAEVRAQAIQIVDKDGLAGLSMRSLAAALGTGPMTLYNYVKDREELEGLVAEAVLADVRLPRRSNDCAPTSRPSPPPSGGRCDSIPMPRHCVDTPHGIGGRLPSR